MATKADRLSRPDVAARLRRIVQEMTQHENFGEMLTQRRLKARLTQQEAADLAGLSLQTYRAAEKSYRPPSDKTVAALDSVPQLRLVAMATEPDWWHTENFDPLGLLRELRATLARPEGQLEPVFLYLDPASAEDYSAITRTPEYHSRTRNPCPLAEAAKTVKERLRNPAAYDVVLLGSGDAATESLFIRQLPPPAAVIAVDISQALLSTAYTRLVDDLPSSRVFALQGDIARLRDYRQLTYRGSVQLVVCLFGKTFSNMPNERGFLESLEAFHSGDLLILDINLSRGVIESEIREKDEALIRGVPKGYSQFLTGPIMRYLPGVRTAKLAYELSMLPGLAGCYSLDCWADVSMVDGGKRRYRVAQFKRYSLSTLLPLLDGYGWKHLATHGYHGQEDKAVLLVWERR